MVTSFHGYLVSLLLWARQVAGNVLASWRLLSSTEAEDFDENLPKCWDGEGWRCQGTPLGSRHRDRQGTGSEAGE